MTENYENEWDKSYKNKDNFVFFPHEDVIRFVSKYIKKRTGFNDYKTQHGLSGTPKVLDLGCGIGRHVKFACDYGLNGHGIDFSAESIRAGIEILTEQGISDANKRLIVGDCSKLPYEDKSFDFAVSHGVLDSMPFEVAKKSMAELNRVLKDSQSLAYIDVISGDDSVHPPEYREEEVVETEHENGTVQSYFNWEKVQEMVGDYFEIKEASITKTTSHLTGGARARHHIVLQKK